MGDVKDRNSWLGLATTVATETTGDFRETA